MEAAVPEAEVPKCCVRQAGEAGAVAQRVARERGEAWRRRPSGSMGCGVRATEETRGMGCGAAWAACGEGLVSELGPLVG